MQTDDNAILLSIDTVIISGGQKIESEGVPMVAKVGDNRYNEGKWSSSIYKFAAKLPKPEIILEPDKTALFIIDMQKGFYLPDSDTLKVIKAESPADYHYFIERLKIVVSNLKKLQDFFRKNNLEIIQCRVCSLTQDGRDRLAPDKTLGIHFPPGSKGAELLDELKPEADEIVLSKTTASMFTPYSTCDILRSMGIEHLVFGGCITEGCVESTVRTALDHFGWANVVVEDCCASFNEDHHVASIRAMGFAFAEIASTQSVIYHLTEQINKSGTVKSN
jgi:nicotinamidase-related amidase